MVEGITPPLHTTMDFTLNRPHIVALFALSMELGENAQLRIVDKDNYGAIIVESHQLDLRYELKPEGGWFFLGQTEKSRRAS